MRRAILSPLTTLSADQLGDLGLHQLLRHSAHRLADHISVLITQHLTNDLSDVILSIPAIAGLLLSKPRELRR